MTEVTIHLNIADYSAREIVRWLDSWELEFDIDKDLNLSAKLDTKQALYFFERLETMRLMSRKGNIRRVL
tara:strand:+ start:792 stop:1001 length:210 start_codon:yes stop_codon:yes gene_type:complete